MLLLLSACASAPDGAVGKTMEFFGLKAPASADEAKAMLPQGKAVALRVHAGDTLNTDAQKRSLSVVVRVYKLRRIDAFLAAPYAAFGNPASEKTAFGDDMLEAREIVMRPSQKHEVVEAMPTGASHIAVVALFRAPAEGRWRFAFDARRADKEGITLGLHGCAISVGVGTPERAPPELTRLAGVQCR